MIHRRYRQKCTWCVQLKMRVVNYLKKGRSRLRETHIQCCDAFCRPNDVNSCRFEFLRAEDETLNKRYLVECIPFLRPSRLLQNVCVRPAVIIKLLVWIWRSDLARRLLPLREDQDRPRQPSLQGRDRLLHVGTHCLHHPHFWVHGHAWQVTRAALCCININREYIEKL